ncbi:glycosyltransferase family 39 protein [Gloeocapsa sp. PCC 73106]|uniref:glycosyltransferase family 39 protein n=1 Tax=Gloeocapsa sp. PCC 73106 TaxID=102232 RepID=UPI0002ACC005|nr:glycosyltransferase family 39 protein [Gloeocapsa sp. PCC 73106]ELR97336.1 Dolichyl-phosphate-mannose-protein mannosyltransferase [Gloeocapsa sp. PCC 73106]
MRVIPMKEISKPVVFLMVIILLLGIFFRWANLEKKTFTGDESITSVRSSGYAYDEIASSIPRDRIITAAAIEKYRQIEPNKSLFDTIRVTANYAPQHTPLYFILVRIWMQCFGNSAMVMRTFSVLTSLLIFPVIYWFSLELFGSSQVAWMAMILVAISPIYIINAQVARPRAFWVLMILLSSLTLLRAIKFDNPKSWALYGITTALSLYSFLFSSLIVVAQAIYVFCSIKTYKSYLLTL